MLCELSYISILWALGVGGFIGWPYASSPTVHFAASAQTISTSETGSPAPISFSPSDPKRFSLTSRSSALNLAHSGPRIDGGLRSPFIRQLKSRNSPPRADQIISATAVSFEEEPWRIGINAKWYATRGWGWRHPENWKTRTYKCVYGMDGRPCGLFNPNYNKYDIWPLGLHCTPKQCCSKSHGALYFKAPLCTDKRELCIFPWREHSYGQCKCEEGMCYGESECVEEIFEHGGVYCRCKDGFIGNGVDCVEDKCKDVDCYPGECRQEGAEHRCSCPSGYEEVDLTCQLIPVCDRGIKDICGSPERVLQCINIGRTDHTCECAPGYALVRTETSTTCDTASNNLSCAQSACGSVGVKECKDNPEGGVTCTCLRGYLLEKQANGLKFQCTPIDPCQGTPCGSESVVKSCSRTVEGSYHCECQPNAELVEATDTEGPYCRRPEEEAAAWQLVAVSVGGLAMLAIGFGVWHFAFRSGAAAVPEYDYTSEAFQSPTQ